MTLLIGKVPFEDDRVQVQNWGEVKPTTPYGSLPLLQFDDHVGVQSDAILRYAGKITGLYPEDPVKALYVDEVIDLCADMMMALYRYHGTDKDEKRAAREKAAKEDVPRYWGGLENRLDAMGYGNGPYVLGESISIADIKILTILRMVKSGKLEFFPPDSMDGYPKLLKSYNTVMNLPEVVDWHEKHPFSLFVN